METDIYSAKIAFISLDNKYAIFCVIPDSLNYPVPVIIKNASFTVGQTIKLRKDIKVSERIVNGKVNYFVLQKGEPNYKVLPDSYKATVSYVSDSGKSVAVSVRINGHSDTVLAFLPRVGATKKGDIIEVSTAQRVYPVTKANRSIFYFFRPGLCNFSIAHRVASSYSPDDDWSDYDQSREDYYEELGSSVCEYCGEYHCDCQRTFDEQWDDFPA